MGIIVSHVIVDITSEALETSSETCGGALDSSAPREFATAGVAIDRPAKLVIRFL